jgi:hypothetical protein
VWINALLGGVEELVLNGMLSSTEFYNHSLTLSSYEAPPALRASVVLAAL